MGIARVVRKRTGAKTSPAARRMRSNRASASLITGPNGLFASKFILSGRILVVKQKLPNIHFERGKSKELMRLEWWNSGMMEL